METNESSFTLKMPTSDGPVQAPQAPFTNDEVVDSAPVVSNAILNEESIKKPVEPEPVENNEYGKQDGMENDISLNNKEEVNCEEKPMQSDSTVKSPVKPSLHMPEDHNESEAIDDMQCEVTSANDREQLNEVQPDQTEAMDEDKEVEEEPVKQHPPQPDSTPAEATLNEEDPSDDETKVEDVTSEVHENKVDESATEPVVEEPQDSEMKEEVDGQTEEEAKTQATIKQQVEISDITDKEEEIQELKKSDEELLLDHISSAYQYLDDFMKTKDEVKIKDCMDLLSEIKTLTVKTVDSLKAFTAEEQKESRVSKKGKRSKSSTKVSKVSSRGVKHDVSNESDSADPLEEVNLKDIKGLAVFAKWPNSGWFYPGVVRDLALSDLKSGNHNLTVTFYDGLERDMKSINIFPAELIPQTSVLFDLDDESDMTVVSVEKEGDWVKYVFTTSGQSEQVTKDFDKMAIKGAHMKSIKQAVDSQAANKSENIVTGRRARGKSSMFNDDYVSSSSPRSTEKRKSKVEDSKSTPAKAPAKRKSSSKDDESGDSTPSRSASKRRQVNGTKSTPRRAAKK